MLKVLGLASMALAGCADTRTCSIQVPLSTPQSEFGHLAQIARGAAEQSARDRLQAGQSGRILVSHLRSESGCLIWSVELTLPGEPGISRVHVDAGDGHVLLVQHERHSGAQTNSANEWFDE